MLQTSGEYLQALREGHYLLFLEWPRFISEHYGSRTDLVDANELVELLGFEWLYHGYNEQDGALFAVIYKLCEASTIPASDGSVVPFPAELEYCIVTMYSVVLRCMAYHSQPEQKLLTLEEELTKAQVLQWMEMTCFDSLRNKRVLEKQSALFSSWLDEIPTESLDKIMVKIKPIFVFRDKLISYLDALAHHDQGIDNLKEARIKEANLLLHYLSVQSGLTAKVYLHIRTHLDKLGSLSPQTYEEDYLKAMNVLIPMTMLGASWHFVEGVMTSGVGFFNVVRPYVDIRSVSQALFKQEERSLK
jgi:hypothetical protein